MSVGLPPWHMWGSAVAVTLNPLKVANAQLARVEYHRPESFRFMFFARILRSNLSVAPAGVIVTFQVNTGTGRASMIVNNFETYEFQILASGEQGASNPKYSTAVAGPARSDLGGTQPDNIVDTIVGQDIQVAYGAAIPTGGLAPTDEVQLEIGCALSPWHHARPDWNVHAFRGGELDGK